MDEGWEIENVPEKVEFMMHSNKWEGEDEDEDVKDSWEDVEEEKKDVEKPAELPKPKAKPKKTLIEKIEERERKAREEAEKKTVERDEALTPEDRRAELLRRQRLQEEADLRLAMETFGVTDNQTGLDALMPNTKEEFQQFGEALAQKINVFNKHAEFPLFAEELIKAISVNLNTASLRKVKLTLDSILVEKIKLDKGKKVTKAKGKARLKVEGEIAHFNEYEDYVYDDFM